MESMEYIETQTIETNQGNTFVSQAIEGASAECVEGIVRFGNATSDTWSANFTFDDTDGKYECSN